MTEPQASETILRVYTEGGLSGDMFLSAFFDLGLPPDDFSLTLNALPLPEWKLDLKSIKKYGIAAKQLSFGLPDEHSHRELKAIEQIIGQSALKDSIKENAIAVFKAIGQAEAKVHDLPVDKVHFHEVGALDSIIDIVGFCIAIDYFKIDKIWCEPFIFGTGFVDCAHGKMPVPVPAVKELTAGLPSIRNYEVTGELVTPTGAALMAVLAQFPPFPALTATKSKLGYGAGQRDYGIPNILRLELMEVPLASPAAPSGIGRQIVGSSGPPAMAPAEGTSVTEAGQATDLSVGHPQAQNVPPPDGVTAELLFEVTANIDDMNPEILGALFDGLFSRGALDVWFIPIQMKKQRPADSINVLCAPGDRRRIAEYLLAETSTLGLRFRPVERWGLQRSESTISVHGQPVRIKTAVWSGGRKVQPEFEDCRAAADALGRSLYEVYQEAVGEAWRHLAD